MGELLQEFFKWAWNLINTSYMLFEWLITPIEILDFNIAPIWLVGGGTLVTGGIALIVGIVRAIA